MVFLVEAAEDATDKKKGAETIDKEHSRAAQRCDGCVVKYQSRLADGASVGRTVHTNARSATALPRKEIKQKILKLKTGLKRSPNI